MGTPLLASTIVPRLAGKVALITGGARGLGECIARVFTEHGAKVVIADILDDLGRSVCDELGPQLASFVHVDVSIESDVQNAVDATITRHGKLDIMINNAAIMDEIKSSILDNKLSDFERVISVNLVGVFLGTKHAARVMVPARSGSIITIASTASIVAVDRASTHAYTSSKHAVVGLTKNVAAELGRSRIRVNCISPYVLPSKFSREAVKDDDLPSTIQGLYSNLQGVTLGFEDVAEAAVFLASDESKYVSGHNLAIDGGFTVINPAFSQLASKG